jgi:hypothetical protein
MSARQAVLDGALARFASAGMRVSVIGTHLVLHDVPVVDSSRRLQLGRLITTFIHTDAAVTLPATHQVWFDGPFPCYADGTAMEALRHSEVNGGEVAPGVAARFHFSNKADGFNGYASHWDQLMHYWRLVTDQARVIDPHCTVPVVVGSITVAAALTPFRYPDAASARSNFMNTSQRLALPRIAIIGLGGTGSFVLDHVSKTPVREIHLFDGDTFEMHNAFRAPGAAPEVAFGTMKVTYFAAMYAPMRSGLVEHPNYVDETNVALLRTFDFVFVCVDKGPARKLICAKLIEFQVPFVDCGMDLSMTADEQIYGTCRATFCTPQKSDHFWNRAPTMEEAGDALYDANIQISDANAINALLAVMRWKQHFAFYAMPRPWHQFEFMIQTNGLAKGDLSDDRNDAD